ncbi:MAG: B12-binding domain-containing radical SAM protein [Anaerolineae bacterium]|nr:B12-binding domain-containing radical SAM protein [Anaerolineae bacterium]
MKPHILFYNPQSSTSRKPVLPLSLLAVGAVLEGKYEYSIADGNLEDNPLEHLDNRIQQMGSNPVLAVTVMPGPQLQQAVPLCQELKRRYPHLIIVWGGYFPTQHWDVALRSDFVDFVVRGHGEMVFLALLGELELGGQNFASIPGLAYKDEAGLPVSNMLAPIPRPHQLPPFNLDRVPVARYLRHTFLGTRTLGYHSSYGCPFFCNFCAVVNMVNGKWYPQTAGQVADVIHQYVARWNVNAVEFYDNNFFVHQERVAEFSERIMDLRLAWWGEGRIDTMLKFNDQTWQLMRDAGLKMVFLGAESGSAETLKRMDKGGTLTPEKTLEMARIMKQWGIVPEMSFVMGNPPDADRDLVETMEFIRKVKQVNPATEIIMYLYTPVPLAGDLYDEAQAEGFAFPQTLEEWIAPAWLNFSQRRSSQMPWIKPTLQQRIYDFERVINAYYPTSTDIKLTSLRRRLLRAVSSWRYHTRFYHFPLELRVVHKLIAYQRPETSGF